MTSAARALHALNIARIESPALLAVLIGFLFPVVTDFFLRMMDFVEPRGLSPTHAFIARARQRFGIRSPLPQDFLFILVIERRVMRDILRRVELSRWRDFSAAYVCFFFSPWSRHEIIL